MREKLFSELAGLPNPSGSNSSDGDWEDKKNEVQSSMLWMKFITIQFLSALLECHDNSY